MILHTSPRFSGAERLEMTKKQVREVIKLFHDKEYGLENAETIGVEIEEFVTMFHAYRAVGGRKAKRIKAAMMQWLYWENKMPIPSIADLFGVTENHIDNICRERVEYDIPEDFGIRKEEGRMCSSGMTFTKSDSKDEFWRKQ